MKVCIGGTFNVFHKGHKYLMDKSFEIAGEKGIVFIGLTKGEITLKKNSIRSYKDRMKSIESYILEKGYKTSFKILPIYDKYGLAVEEDYDVIIVSPETVDNAKLINQKRKNLGKKPMKIITMPHVLAEDNHPISSTRILKKEIDENGRILE